MEDNRVKMKIQLDFSVIGIGNVTVTTFEEEYLERYVANESPTSITGRIYDHFIEEVSSLNLTESMLTKKQYIITHKEEF